LETLRQTVKGFSPWSVAFNVPVNTNYRNQELRFRSQHEVLEHLLVVHFMILNLMLEFQMNILSSSTVFADIT